MHSAEGAMFPKTELALSFREISDYWSREMRPTASSNELLSILVSAWWLGELPSSSVHSRLQLLKMMSKYRDDLGIVFIVGDDGGPPQVELPDGSLEIDVRPQIRVPSSNTETWDEAACSDPFHALAKATEVSIDIYREDFMVFLLSIKVTYEEFNAWLRSRGYSLPTFWRRTADRHLGSVASQRSIKTWHAKAAKSLAASERAGVKAIKEIAPDGSLEKMVRVCD